jgi:hypothetical protein
MFSGKDCKRDEERSLSSTLFVEERARERRAFLKRYLLSLTLSSTKSVEERERSSS